MPKPLILLEQHAGTGARSFISEHAAELKALGYSKFLLEMNSELSHNQVKQELQMILKIYAPDTMLHRSTKAMYEMLMALEKNNIPYAFIDPETRDQATQNTARLKEAYYSNLSSKLQLAREEQKQNTKSRDQKIIKSILQQTAEHEGGVIYMGGFMHVHMVHELEQSKHDYRFAMFANSHEENPVSGVIDSDTEIWAKLYSADFRHKYFQTNVLFFNMAYDNRLSFEAIEAACQLTEQRILKEDELPQVARDFEQLMPGQTYSVDKHHVVTASKQFCHPEAAVEAFVRAGLGFRFFMTKEQNGTTRVDVPGLNLKENRDLFKTI